MADLVTELAASETHDLRRRVLRAATPDTDLVWPGDDLATTLHLGVVAGDDAVVVAISTWLRTASPDIAGTGHVGSQLRGMATDPSVRGSGIGSLLLRAGIERAERNGADHVWANARSTVLDFYVAHGFEIASEEFLSAETAIAHRRVLRRRPGS